MIQIIQILHFKQSYPFGLQKQTLNTFVQVNRTISSEKQLNYYKFNLNLYKQLQSDLLIKLDSYIIQSNILQIYYQYQPLSILLYLQQKSKQYSNQADQHKDQFILTIINNINHSIQQIATYLTERKILAVLSIQSIAITKQQKLKFFIDPDFQILPNQQQSNNEILLEYYQTQKKKLHIQIEEKLENCFNKKLKIKKANFIIQGTKLVFVPDDDTTRQSSLENIARSTLNNNQPIIISKTQNNQKNQKIISTEIKSQKFDIANILDEKKMQKNHQKFYIQQKANPIAMNITNEPQKNPFAAHMLKKQIKRSISSQQQVQKELMKLTKHLNQMNLRQKQVKNYFQNNDDFNKDASFYPQQFIKQDSISELEGYEDELERQLQDLKKNQINKQSIQFEEENNILYKNQLEGGHAKVKITEHHDPQPQKSVCMSMNARLSMEPGCVIHGFGQSSKQSLRKQSTHHHSQPNPPKQTNHSNSQNSLNVSNPNNNTSSNSQQHSSQLPTGQKRKKKYKIKITTEHQVDIEQQQNGQQVNLKQIQQEIINDIRKGNLNLAYKSKGNVEQIKLVGGEVHDNMSQKGYNSSLGRQSHKQITQIVSTTSERNIEDSMHKTNLPQHNINSLNSNRKEEIQKILQKIKNSAQNKKIQDDALRRQSIRNQKDGNLIRFMQSQQNNGSSSQSQHQILPSVTTLSSLPSHFNNVTKFIAQQPRPVSHISHSNSPLTQPITLTQDKDYLQKIQKAKSKAQQIMRLVKQRKTNNLNL